MLKKRCAILQIVLACLVLALVLHLYSTFFFSRYYGISPSEIILIITAGVVFWYAWETRQLRKEQSMPFVSVLFQEYDLRAGTKRTRFLVKNYGKGTAINIEFKALEYIEDKKPIFRRMGALSPWRDEELLIEEVHYDDNKDSQTGPVAISDFLSHIKLCLNFDKYFFELSYRDILGGSFITRGVFEQSIPGTWNFVRKKG